MGLFQEPHQGRMDRQEDSQEILNLTLEQIPDAVDRVYNKAFAPNTWNGSDTSLCNTAR